LDKIFRLESVPPLERIAFALLGRAERDFVTHNFSKAKEDFRVVLETEPDDYRSLFYLGYSKWRLGETGGASRQLQRSVDIIQCTQINFVLAPETLAQVELQNGDLDNAFVHSNLALSMAAQSKNQEDNLENAPDVLLLRGKIHLALSKQQEAIKDGDRTLEVNPALAEC
jgi:tetratricopeptide (TPR) repeat protein